MKRYERAALRAVPLAAIATFGICWLCVTTVDAWPSLPATLIIAAISYGVAFNKCLALLAADKD